MHFGAGFFNRNTGPEAPDHLNAIAIPGGCGTGPPGGGDCQRSPEARIAGRQLKAARHDANHHVGGAVDRERLAERAGRSREPLSPKPLAEYNDVLPPFEFLAREGSPNERLGAEQIEEPGAHQTLLRLLGSGIARVSDLADLGTPIERHFHE